MTDNQQTALTTEDANVPAQGSLHTPGPWKATLHFGQWSIRQDPKDWDGMGYQSIGSVGRFHADRKGTHYGEMFRANAQLIAAAPDLLDIAKQYASECLECNYGDGATGKGSEGEPCEGCADLRAVIAKAEGRS